MRNLELVKLNFCQLINYGGQPPIEVRYSQPQTCYGYCIDCERHSLVKPGQLDQMSHGCDTSDFIAVLGPLPTPNPVNIPVLFLLEDPGGYYGNGASVPFEGHLKQPPVNHYYFSPDAQTWPSSSDQLRNIYGPYFAYLMKKHGLTNVYITNLVQCGLSREHRNLKKTAQYRAVRTNCVKHFLNSELLLFDPKVVFCLGRRAWFGLKSCVASDSRWLPVYLVHPAARKKRVHIIQKNDAEIKRVFEELQSTGAT